MASIRNPEGLRLRGFRAGMNNVAPDQDLPTNEFGITMALREALNVDLVGPSKKARRRAGYTLKVPGSAHSPWGFEGRLLAAVDGDLCAYDSSFGLLGTVRADVGDRRISYAAYNDDLYWSNGAEIRRLRGRDFADLPVWIDAPGVPNAQALGGGSLAAGAYRVAMTWLDAEGRESGAAGAAEADVADGGALRVYNIPSAPADAVTARVYVSPPNGEELYATADLSPLVTQTVITQVGDGKALETLWRQPLPPCEILRAWSGRLLGGSGNLLVWSDPLRPGLTTHDNYMRFGARITLLEPVGEGTGSAGVFVADHAKVYWLDGAKPDEWSRSIRYSHPAVPGTSLVVPGTDVGLEAPDPVAAWMSANGVFCLGLPGGRVVPLTEGRLAAHEDGVEGAAMLRVQNGLRQLVMSYMASTTGALAVGDRATATVIRHSS